MAAAAAVRGLQSLTLRTDSTGSLWLPDSLLLPLAAAAGGPGSILTKLVLNGHFRPQDAAAAGFDCTDWHLGLKQLDGLLDLSILHASHNSEPCTPRDLCNVPINRLPVSLTSLNGANLNITTAAGATAVGSGSVGNSGNASALANTLVDSLQLQKLQLTHCHLSSPSILATDQLQQLVLCDCIWPGGWTAATTAWPHVRQLACQWSYNPERWPRNDEISTSSTEPVSGQADRGSRPELGVEAGTVTDSGPASPQLAKAHVEEAVMEMSAGFKCLRSIEMVDMPSLSAEVLQQIKQVMKEVRSITLVAANQAKLYDLSPQCLQAAQTAGSEAGSSNSSYSSSNIYADLRAARRWLQQQMPWARSVVELPWEVVPVS